MSGFACFGLGVVVGILAAALMASTALYDQHERAARRDRGPVE